MDTTEIVGALAALSSLAVIAFGLTHQIVQNFRRKSYEGLSPLVVYTAVPTYTLWAIYGWLKPDDFLKAAQTPGACLAWILLYQLWLYRR